MCACWLDCLSFCVFSLDWFSPSPSLSVTSRKQQLRVLLCVVATWTVSVYSIIISFRSRFVRSIRLRITNVMLCKCILHMMDNSMAYRDPSAQYDWWDVSFSNSVCMWCAKYAYGDDVSCTYRLCQKVWARCFVLFILSFMSYGRSPLHGTVLYPVIFPNLFPWWLLVNCTRVEPLG